MGLEVVVSEIIEEGRKQASAIEREGLEEAKAILQDARDKAKKVLDEKRTQGERDAARITTQERARAEFDSKKRVLTAKRGLWDRLHEDTLKALAALPEDRRRRLLRRLLEKAAAEIPTGRVHVRKQDTGLLQGVARHEVVGDLDAVGGLVVEDATGTVSLDYRFESILADVWPTVLKEESKRLFG